MAILKTLTATMQEGAPAANTWTRQNGPKLTGDLMYREVFYTVPASGAPVTGDVLRLCKAPTRSYLVAHLCKIVCPAMGTAMNISKIGDITVDGVTIPSDDLDDDDRYSAAVSAITAGGAFDFNYAGRPGGLAGYFITREQWIIATFGTVTTPTPGAIIRFVLAFAVQS